MKKLYILLCLFVGTSLFAQGPADIVFKATTHSFGKIKQNVPATYVFSFTNNGSKAAVIEFANAECGCTTPKYSDGPILKGKTSTITVTYNAASPGTFKKNVNVKFVGTQLPVTLTIDGEVLPAPAAKAKAK